MGTAQEIDIHKRYILSVEFLTALYFGTQYKDNVDERDFFDYYYNTDDSLGDPDAPGTDDDASGQHHIDWFRKGVDADGHLSACNTWTAPASEVS